MKTKDTNDIQTEQEKISVLISYLCAYIIVTTVVSMCLAMFLIKLAEYGWN